MKKITSQELSDVLTELASREHLEVMTSDGKNVPDDADLRKYLAATNVFERKSQKSRIVAEEYSSSYISLF